jgi:adenine-specific DNA-methyltransferase
MQKLDPKTDGRSVDIVAENIDKLKTLFPEVFSEGGIDFDALKETLGEYIDGKEERYSFTWNGKSKARWLAQTPSTGTLRPCPEESVNWDTTQNLFIEGDNLEVLKLLQKSYYKKVKMIYIDPPYNTGKDFIYPDDFRDNIQNYLELTRQVDSEGKKVSSNPETNGRYHTNWLNMMYPRLKLARNLLRDDGVIFISIDDNEMPNLRKTCDEIFGEENFIGQFIWQKGSGTQNDNNYVAVSHEYILLYSKVKEYVTLFNLPPSAEMLKTYDLTDEYVAERGKHYLRNLNDFSIGDRPGLHYDIVCPDGSILLGREHLWRCDADRFEWRKENGRIVFKKDIDGQWNVLYKQYLFETKEEVIKDKNGNILSYGKIADTLLIKVSSTGDGTKEIKSIFEYNCFSYPKPTKLIKHFLQIGTKSDELILDFFSGSCTTAHSILEMNKEDGGTRKFIMVQLPEPIYEIVKDEKIAKKEFIEAFKAGYETIAEIGKDRIRRVITKIRDENSGYQGDLGFKVFKLDSTNIKPWDVNFNNFERTLDDYITNIKNDRSENDILYEILLKYGLDLTLPIEERNIDGKIVFVIGYGALVICLADDITLETVEGIASLKKELQPEIMRVVFKDMGFKNDVVKTNAVQILKLAGIEDVKSL